jgi:hypothetical protein
MPPPKPKRFFKIRRKADGLFFRNTWFDFEKQGSKLREKELLRIMKRLAEWDCAADLEVVRFDIVPFPPRSMVDLLKIMEEAEKKDWPLL